MQRQPIDRAWLKKLQEMSRQAGEEITAAVGKPLSKKERKRLPRAKSRGAVAAPALLESYLNNPEVHFPGLPDPQEVKTAQIDAQQLLHASISLHALASHLMDAARVRTADVWRTQMDLYSIFKRIRVSGAPYHRMKVQAEKVKAAMRLGPRTQKHVMQKLEKPTPRGKAAERELAARALKAQTEGKPPKP